MTFVRYVTIQIIAYGIDMGVFLIVLNTTPSGALLANLAGKISAGIFAFLVHQSFTFRISKADRHSRQAVRYFILLGINIPLSSLVLGAILYIISFPVIAKILSDVICVIITFLISKTWVFSLRQNNSTYTPDIGKEES